MQNKQQNKSHQITYSGNSLLKAKTPGFNVLEKLLFTSQLRSSNLSSNLNICSPNLLRRCILTVYYILRLVQSDLDISPSSHFTGPEIYFCHSSYLLGIGLLIISVTFEQFCYMNSPATCTLQNGMQPPTFDYTGSIAPANGLFYAGLCMSSHTLSYTSAALCVEGERYHTYFACKIKRFFTLLMTLI